MTFLNRISGITRTGVEYRHLLSTHRGFMDIINTYFSRWNTRNTDTSSRK